jgi:hypothetical protein
MATDSWRLEVEVQPEQRGQASAQATELEDYIRDAAPDVAVERVRTDPTAQDFGATLAILLAAPSIVALAKGISRWLDRRNTSTVTLKSAGRTFTVENISARSAAQLAQEITRVLEDEPGEKQE